MDRKRPFQALLLLDELITKAEQFLAENGESATVDRLRSIFTAVVTARRKCDDLFACGKDLEAMESTIRLTKKLARFYRIAGM